MVSDSGFVTRSDSEGKVVKVGRLVLGRLDGRGFRVRFELGGGGEGVIVRSDSGVDGMGSESEVGDGDLGGVVRSGVEGIL